MDERDTCGECGAEVDSLAVDGYDFVQPDGRRLCVDCQWDEDGGAIYAAGGIGEDQVGEKWG